MLEKGSYHSTPFGRKYISVVPENLKAPELTSKIEEQLAQIGEGTISKKEFLQEIIGQITEYVESVKGNIPEEETVGICPFCNQPITANRYQYACKTKDCFQVNKVICGKKIVPRMVQDILNTGKTGMIKGFVGKSGKVFDARLVYKNKKIEFEFPQKR